MVEVFKTNIEKKTETEMLIWALSRSFPLLKINVDLSDCDRVLRVEGEHIEPTTIMALVQENGFMCEVIE